MSLFHCKQCDVLGDDQQCWLCGRFMEKYVGTGGRNPYNWVPGQATVGDILDEQVNN